MGKSYFLNDKGPRPDEPSYWLSADNGLKQDSDLIAEARAKAPHHPIGK